MGQGMEGKAGVVVVYEGGEKGWEVEVLVVFGGRWMGLKRKKRKREQRRWMLRGWDARGAGFGENGCSRAWMLERTTARGDGF